MSSIQVVTALDQSSHKPKIILFRYNKWAQNLVNYTIAEGNRQVGLITSGGYLHWETEPGLVTIHYRAHIPPTCNTFDKVCLTVKDDNFEINTEYPEREFKFTVEEGGIYYLDLRPNWFLLTDIPRGVDISVVSGVDLDALNAPHVSNVNLE
ncbi:hypothetical protein ACFL2V_05745 [Pseudomonadota bacterium]